MNTVIMGPVTAILATLETTALRVSTVERYHFCVAMSENSSAWYQSVAIGKRLQDFVELLYQ